MANPLFERVSPTDLASRRQVFEIKGKISDFGRLVEIVEADLSGVRKSLWPAKWQDSVVEIMLAFSFADSRNSVPLVSGSATISMPARCQRCLELFTLPVGTKFDLLLVESGSMATGDDGQEAWEYDQAQFRPGDMVEESLVMAIPFAAMHNRDQNCPALTDPVEDPREDRVRPFVDLRARLNELNK